MQFLVSYDWQQGGENTTSLVLQQAFHKYRKMPVLLAAVGQEKSDGFAAALVDWYYREGLLLCGKYGEQKMEKIERHLRTFMKDRKIPEMAGILCVGSAFLMFRRGSGKIWIRNTRNNHSCCRELSFGQEQAGAICFLTGSIQPGVSVMLATKDFDSGGKQIGAVFIEAVS